MTEYAAQLLGKAKVVALATDGSSYTDGAVQEAIFLAQGCGAKIIVFNIVAVDSESVTGIRASPKPVDQKLTDYLDNIKKMTDDSGIACDIIIEESYYSPEKTLVDLAYKHNADILIMGRHGKRGLLKLLVGGMTSKVIGQGFPQVLVVPHECSIKGEKILVASDGSEAAQVAAETALSMAMACNTLQHIYALSVVSSKSELEEAQKLVDTFCTKGNEKAPHVTFHSQALAEKSAADIILQTAVEKEVDMILIGGHGKGFSRLLMGHVTEKVIGKAQCAVLVIEKEKKAKEQQDTSEASEC